MSHDAMSQEQQELFMLEERIKSEYTKVETLEEAKRPHYLIIGQDLRNIQLGKKYRLLGFQNFESYCESERLPFGYKHALRLIAIDDVARDVAQPDAEEVK
jgi:hypothetical protein